MADFSIAEIARRGLGKLVDPRGRDSRMQFWIFVIIVFAPLIVAVMGAQMVLTFSPLDIAGASDPQSMEKIFAAQAQGMAIVAHVNLGIFMLGSLLLLSATARRLHDRGHSGWWALTLPFAIGAAGLGQARQMLKMADRMPKIWADMERQQDVDPVGLWKSMIDAQYGGGGIDWLAIVGGLILLWLVVELARAGSTGANRFGPVPD